MENARRLLALLSFTIPFTASAAIGAEAHYGSSPFPPPPTEDTRFVVDVGAGLDRGCTFRSSGPRLIQVDIKRHVGAVDGSGHLLNVDELIANKIVSPTAKIRFPAYDIDDDANVAPDAPELDRLTFNGHDLGNLTGDNNVWKLNEFEVPIAWVKFPPRGADGGEPAAAGNEVRIDIDTGNASTGQTLWCMDVDWVEIEFAAMAPFILVHGTASNSGSWDGAFLDQLTSLRVPVSRDVNMPGGGNQSFDTNAAFLRQRVVAIARGFGARKVHLVAHSKGGTDSRRFLAAYSGSMEVEVLSLYTIGTPHAGTILSDLSSARRNLNDPKTDDPLVKEFWRSDALAGVADAIGLGNTPQDPALTEQTVGNMARFNAANPYGARARFYNLAADADQNNNRQIEASEAVGLLPWGTREKVGSLMYRVLGNISGITVVRRTNLWGLNEWHDVSALPTAAFTENDLVVTTPSARHAAGTMLGGIRNANHGTIRSQQAAMDIVGRVRADYPLR